MLAKLISVIKKQDGQGLVEYALIIVLISIVAIAMMGPLGTQIGQVFTDIRTELGGV